jgi:predicted alpha/beta superfamily hydrolase
MKRLSPSRVEKVALTGSLGARALYVYLPPGYDSTPEARYPVLYMHDGQNCFERYAEDSFSGSWQADLTADRLVREGRMRPCLIVGVSNGRERRLSEYLPPYSRFRYQPPRRKGARGRKKRPVVVEGQADQTAAFYLHEVAPFIQARYRVLAGREHTATCGASMGGLFSFYLALSHPEFARHHAVMSPSFWITRNQDGTLEVLERLRRYPKRELRLWLDSGEGTEKLPGGDDDNKFVTLEAREALIAAGYAEGEEFVYYLDEGASHHESAWAKRLDKVLSYLFPASASTSTPQEAARATAL